MKTIYRSAAAVALLCAIVGASVSAQAETYVVSQSRSNVIACYNKVYVPAKVLVNTRGIRVKGESESWVVGGDQWLRVRNPAVYIQTRKTLEADHFTLVPCN